MKDSSSLIVRKQGILGKLISKFKNLFHNEIKEEVPIREASKYMGRKEKFMKDIKISIDTEISVLKIKLESGEIRAIELTDEQIEQLQKIYDEEILQKRKKLEKLKKKG